ncbi:MAG: SapC family protein [Proteobacteria bacterium]|nr:SapC family protein [Pseudomonadota bacterium]
MANLLFYKKPVALNKQTHKGMHLKSMENNFSFARDTNSVILAGVEFSEAAKDYPIVFAKSGDSIVPVALLGLRNSENLFIQDDGSWDARYIPAFVRRYPFVLAAAGENSQQRVVCIDESYPGISEQEGQALFEGDEPMALLKQAIGFLEEYQKQYVRTETFLRRLQALDLLVSLNAKVDLVDGQQFSMSGLLVVDEKKLLNLDDAKAIEFFRSGELSWVYCHLMSLGCLGGMVNRVAARVSKDGGVKQDAGNAEQASAGGATDDASKSRKAVAKKS